MPGEALVRVHRVGICGTDISGYLGKMPFFSYPRIPGHELGVEVVAVGDGVTNVKPGDRCSVEPYINDPNSYASRRGQPNCCEQLQVLGVHTDGGLRPLFIVPARKLHPAKSLSFEQLALVETLAIGCHAADRSGVADGEIVPDHRRGADRPGDARIRQAHRREDHRARCQRAAPRLLPPRDGSRAHACSPSDQLEAELRDLTDGHLPDVVIDATGNQQSMSSAFGLVAPGGRLVFVGITTEEVRFRHPIFHRPEGTLLCSRNALPSDFTRIIGLIEAGQIDTQPWITHRSSLADLPAAMPTYLQPDSGVVKAMVTIGA